MRPKAATETGVMGASVPPATTTSADPSRISRAASPIAFEPAAHAVVMQRFGPVQPLCIEITPAVAFGIIMGMKNGEMRLGPRVMKVSMPSSMVVSPPMPVPLITAHRAGSAPMSPASAMASVAAVNPSWVARSNRRLSFGPR